MIPGIKERSNHEKHLVIDFSKDILSEKFFQKAQFMEIIEPDYKVKFLLLKNFY